MVPVFNISTTKYTRYRADETPLEKLILGNQSVLYGQPNNESMSPDGLRKPDRIVPVNRRPLWPKVMKIKAQRIRDARAFTTYIGNSILIMENSDLGGCETLETPNIFLFPSVLSFISILIWSWFILERFVLQVKVEVALFNLESLFFLVK